MQFLMLLAILPTIVLIVFIYKQDKIEKEPPKLLAILFGLGAATVISALILERHEGSSKTGTFVALGAAILSALGAFIVLRSRKK